MGNICKQEPQKKQLQQMQQNPANIPLKIKSHPKRGDGPSSSFAKPVKSPVLQQHIQQILNQNNNLRPEELTGSPMNSYYINQRELVYEGQWRNKKPHGKGKVYFDNGAYFEGYFNQGQAECQDGIFIYLDGSHYRGQIKKSIIDGSGRFQTINKSVVYNGYWKQNKPHGYGIEKFADGNKYEGDFKNGYKHGLGQFIWADGSQYKGSFKMGYMWGQGVYRKGNSYYEGNFEKNAKNSENGSMKTEYGRYEGSFMDGKMCGQGRFYWDDKKVYTGQFRDGKIHGQGKIEYPNGQKIYGKWEEGQNIEIEKIQH